MSCISLSDAEPCEPTFADLAAGRDDLLVQPLAVAADDHEPGVGNHGDVFAGHGRAPPGPSPGSAASLPSVDQTSARSSRRLICTSR